LVWLSVYAWSVTEPEAVELPGWQTGAKDCVFTVNHHTPQGTDLADNSLDGMECTEHHLVPGVWQALCLPQCPY